MVWVSRSRPSGEDDRRPVMGRRSRDVATSAGSPGPRTVKARTGSRRSMPSAGQRRRQLIRSRRKLVEGGVVVPEGDQRHSPEVRRGQERGPGQAEAAKRHGVASRRAGCGVRVAGAPDQRQGGTDADVGDMNGPDHFVLPLRSGLRLLAPVRSGTSANPAPSALRLSRLSGTLCGAPATSPHPACKVRSAPIVHQWRRSRAAQSALPEPAWPPGGRSGDRLP